MSHTNRHVLSFTQDENVTVTDFVNSDFGLGISDCDSLCWLQLDFFHFK
jgi:hypothetical protein